MSKTIIFGFSKPKKFHMFSWAVMAFSKTPYSHVYIEVNNNYFNDTEIYQASRGMVNHVLKENFIVHNDIIKEFKFEITDEAKYECINFLRKRLGLPYSFKSIFIIFLARFGLDLRRFSDGDKAYICSELGARVVKASKITDLSIDVDLITPKELFEIFEKITN